MARVDPLAAWQSRLLPLMAILLVASAAFFAWQSVAEFSDFKARITPPKTDLAAAFQGYEQTLPAGAAERLDYLQWKTMVLLEQEALKHRYAQINATILARVWTRLMGFTTGMVLAIVGAAFILGKLQEAQTELKQESELIKVSLATSSPGIVLAVLGSVLMSITLLTRFDIDVRDASIYLNARGVTPAPAPRDPGSLMAQPPRPGPPPMLEAK